MKTACTEIIERKIVTDHDLFHFKSRPSTDNIELHDVILSCANGHFNGLYKCKHGAKLKIFTSKTKRNPDRQYYCCSQSRRDENGDFSGGCYDLDEWQDPDVEDGKKFHPGYWFWRDSIEPKEEPLASQNPNANPNPAQNDEKSSASTFQKYRPRKPLTEVTNSTFQKYLKCDTNEPVDSGFNPSENSAELVKQNADLQQALETKNKENIELSKKLKRSEEQNEVLGTCVKALVEKVNRLSV